MGYAAKILKDSITNDGARLTTFEVTIPRIVLAEFNTHRMLSRNSASSRAIPVAKRIQTVKEDPFIPEAFGRNKKGMQAGGLLDEDANAKARALWLDGRDEAIRIAEGLASLEVHKQLANRVLEPYLWHTIVVSATEWDNWDALRCHEAAQPEIRKPAETMRELRLSNVPKVLRFGQWHLPYVEDDEADELLRVNGFSSNELAYISAGRCARVSVKTFDGTTDPRADLDLAIRLRSAGHMSPLEHPAQAYALEHAHEFMGNFRGWKQLRKTVRNEHNFALIEKTS